MARVRRGSEPGTARPFQPDRTAAPTDFEDHKADALDQIARSLTTIDHHIEVIAQSLKEQNSLIRGLLMAAGGHPLPPASELRQAAAQDGRADDPDDPR